MSPLAIRALLACAGALSLAGPAAALAAAPAPGASAAADAGSQCPARVFDVVPLDVKTAPSRTYAIIFEASLPNSAHLSGSIALYHGDDRYEVPFPEAVASGWYAATLPEVTPVVVQLPSALSVDAAYLSALDGTNGGPCAIAYPWLPRHDQPRAGLKTVLDTFEDSVRKKAAHVTPIEAAAPVHEGAPPCAVPNALPYVTQHVAPVGLSPGEEAAEGIFISEVSLADTGSVEDAWLWGWAGTAGVAEGLNRVAVQTAKSALYAPEKFRCKSVASIYFSVMSFRQSPQGGLSGP
jgi:hypothetical protein